MVSPLAKKPRLLLLSTMNGWLVMHIVILVLLSMLRTTTDQHPLHIVD